MIPYLQEMDLEMLKIENFPGWLAEPHPFPGVLSMALVGYPHRMMQHQSGP